MLLWSTFLLPLFQLTSVAIQDPQEITTCAPKFSRIFQRNPKIKDSQKKATQNIGLKICNKLQQKIHTVIRSDNQLQAKMVHSEGSQEEEYTNLQKKVELTSKKTCTQHSSSPCLSLYLKLKGLTTSPARSQTSRARAKRTRTNTHSGPALYKRELTSRQRQVLDI